MSLATKQTALVLGESSSIGRPLVDKLIASGFVVIATQRKVTESDARPGLHRLALDIRSEESQANFVQQLIDLNLKIDLAVFTAGILPGNSLLDYDDPTMEDVMNVNFTGQAKLLRRIEPRFRDEGQVLMVSSISAVAGSYDPIYAASKGAVLSFVKALSKWHAPRIRVNAIAPGLIMNSAMYDAMSDDRKEFHKQDTPTKELVDPENLASMIVDMSAPHWRHLNGACIHVNGGRDVR